MNNSLLTNQKLDAIHKSLNEIKENISVSIPDDILTKKAVQILKMIRDGKQPLFTLKSIVAELSHRYALHSDIKQLDVATSDIMNDDSLDKIFSSRTGQYIAHKIVKKLPTNISRRLEKHIKHFHQTKNKHDETHGLITYDFSRPNLDYHIEHPSILQAIQKRKTKFHLNE